ncbi:hypothetical protein DPEC_G00149910 [Dallia pectoralis]|uniref:Uncharacterized protein n=1 Tax=Dallia pectoralis TaxID=75939 RepID=A0ACC2GIS6_DALPE|nr:hypothetical protein DPEC_G00149910 [Dallia pectoralis]
MAADVFYHFSLDFPSSIHVLNEDGGELIAARREDNISQFECSGECCHLLQEMQHKERVRRVGKRPRLYLCPLLLHRPMQLRYNLGGREGKIRQRAQHPNKTIK